MNMNDRRVKKTKKALQLALAELILSKELRNITVQELADKADIHRATFYSHYHDVYDLYEQLENDVITELDSLIIGNSTHDYKNTYKAIIDYLYANPTLSRLLFSDNSGSPQFKKYVCNLIEKKYLDIWIYEEPNTTITDDMRYIITYHIQGLTALIGKWVNSNFSYSKEKMIMFLEILDTNIERVMDN